MSRPLIRCSARMLNGFVCRVQARWWVDYRGPAASGPPIQARCNNHSRSYPTRWRLLSADPNADRAVAEGIFT